jgi:hypothetical protein
MTDRLAYIKQTLDKQKNRPAVVLRRSDVEWAVSEIERLRKENEYHEQRMKMYEKRAIHLAAENDLLKVSLKQADSKRAAEIINDHFKGGEW